jgi:DNA mismatch repair ATPase MutS
LIDYEYLCNAIVEHQAELIEIYDALGLLDSLISIASFRESVPFYCAPELNKPRTDPHRHLDFDGLCHPLIRDAVPNSLKTDRPVLVTGSNASGKSTFLKTVAINAILAQTFNTCLAHRYSSSFFAIITSMAVRDNITNGESYFIAEIKSLKRILDYRNEEIPCLCLIDEVLRGTNTVERIASSSQLLLQLAAQDCLSIAATHDLELTFILESCYRNVHFEEAITDSGIFFDYLLRDGRANSRNAIKLLRLMGYGEAIVKQAESRADRFVSRGSWMDQ